MTLTAPQKASDSLKTWGDIFITRARFYLIIALVCSLNMSVSAQQISEESKPTVGSYLNSDKPQQTTIVEPVLNNVVELDSATAPNVVIPTAVSRHEGPEAIFSPSKLLQWLLSLLFVLALIYGAAWYMRKMQGIGVVSGQRMQVISALSVGARERVVLIQVGEKQMLLGVAPGRVNYIKELEQTLTSKDQEL